MVFNKLLAKSSEPKKALNYNEKLDWDSSLY